MIDQTITNEMLHEFLKEMKADTNRRFDEMSSDTNRRFEDLSGELKSFKADTNRRFDEMIVETSRRLDAMTSEYSRRCDWIEDQVRSHGKKLDLLYDDRGKVTVNFTRSWAMASFFMATFAGILVLAVEKAF